MRLSSCCTYFLIFSRLHRRTSPAAEVCSHRRTSLAAVACLQPSPQQFSRSSLQQKPHQPSGGSSQPLPQRWGGTARIMHCTGPAARVRSQVQLAVITAPVAVVRSHCRTEPAAEDNSHHRTGLAAQDLSPSPHQSSR